MSIDAHNLNEQEENNLNTQDHLAKDSGENEQSRTEADDTDELQEAEISAPDPQQAKEPEEALSADTEISEALLSEQGTGDEKIIEADAASEDALEMDADADAEEGETPAVQGELKPKAKRKRKQSKEAEPEKPVTILHMVFDEPGGEQIRQSFELDPANTGEIIYIEDNYSLGPVGELETPEGWQLRKGWWQAVLGLDPETQPEVMSADKMKLHQLLQRLEEQQDTVLWIWMGQNERDVAGYYYIISHLMDFQGRIYVVYLNNLPFIDEKGHIFYPRQLSEILPKEYVKAARLARIVTLSEFELDPEEWEKLSQLPGSVRLLEGGKKLAVKENDYYDKIILDQLGAAAMKLSRLLGLLATKAKLGLPEYYIIWRIKSLIETGQVISQGEFEKGGKNVTLKATQGQMFVELNAEQEEDSAE
ncbi:Protein of unknown function [Arachidicoccus rhizosphaerae]|uniref:DUF1835 domain-containing protein n=1 Tax=Arachidicoccus rhizosphaerae TaxID=551991 RepID=A0A1H3WW86_9BACT|nr:DUF1835 domain-containing protein [Arachidicoccus rhizosphaerae]SDZ91230.1 Protein of unknown function [Arachidicoccus rhizosphaerae]